MSKKASFWFFLLAAVVNLAGRLFDWTEIANFSKILLMPFLLYYVYESTRGYVTKNILLLGLAIVFSWIGDILLIKDDYFLFGIGAFFITQIVYIILFKKSNPGAKPTLRIAYYAPYVIYGAGFFYLILPEAGELRIPIIVYGIALLLMGMMAVSRNRENTKQSYLLIVLGSTLFIISDTMIAAGMFLKEFPFREFLIMLTYVIAQWLICRGIILYNAKEMADHSE